MNLPETCPFCGAGILVMAGGFECRNGRWATFDCSTSIHAGQAERRTQSRTCEDAERTRLAARVAELEVENKTLRDRFSDADTERNAAQAGLKAAFARVAELEAENKNLSNRAELADGDVKKAHAILDASDTYIRRIEVELQSESQAKIDAEFHVAALKERLAEMEADSKRLDWLLRRGVAWRDCHNDWWREGEWLYESGNTRSIIDEAMEAKP